VWDHPGSSFSWIEERDDERSGQAIGLAVKGPTCWLRS
jgi:hypothetical protein